MTISAASAALSVEEKPLGNELPRVLVIGPDLPHLGYAGGIQLHRLFQDWPPESLLAAGPSVPPDTQRLSCRFAVYHAALARLDATRAVRPVQLLRALDLIPSKQFKLPSFQPSAIVNVFSSLAYSQAAYRYSRHSGVPLILIVHDDPEDFNRGYAWARGLLRRQFRRIYRHASLRLCVSPELEQTLRERYGAAGKVMHPIRSEAIVPRSPEASLALMNPSSLTLGYAGSLNYGYGPRLLELVPLLRQSGTKIRIYGADLPAGEYSDVLLGQGRSRTPEEAWTHIKQECDAVLLPYCFANHGHQNLYRTHFPSKLPEYLALGMPVVVTGPIDAAGVKWGLRHPGSCIVITQQDGQEWVNALAQLKHDETLRLRLSKSAVVAGNSEFEPSSIRLLFQRSLKNIAVDQPHKNTSLLWLMAKRIYRVWQAARAELIWRIRGCPAPLPPHVKRSVLRKLAKQHRSQIFVESGTYYGETLGALRCRFEELHSIELSDDFYQRAVKRFAHDLKIHLWHGDSGHVLANVATRIHGRALFWLDGHYSGGSTALGCEVTPIMRELKIIAAMPARSDHLVVVDDARLFNGTDGYPTMQQLCSEAAALGLTQINLANDMILLQAPN